jgi:hypothetical protein
MTRDFLRPNSRRTESNPHRRGDTAQSREAVESCEHCNAEGAEIPFDNILDRVTGSDPSVTDYVLEQP